jgi:hypothetical protein
MLIKSRLLTHPTPVVLERDLFPGDHCFIVGVP